MKEFYMEYEDQHAEIDDHETLMHFYRCGARVFARVNKRYVEMKYPEYYNRDDMCHFCGNNNCTGVCVGV